MSQNDTLSSNQRRALAAILACRTIGAAATACGLSEKTLYRYLELPEFRRALTQRETETIDQAGRILLEGQAAALATLNEIRKGAKRDSDRRQAAVAWLDMCLRWRELRNVEQRLNELEAAIYGNKNH